MANTTTSTNDPTESKGDQRKRKGNVPEADIDFGSLCTNVSGNWNSNKWLTLRWLTAGEFEANAAGYNKLLANKSAQGGSRPQITGNLKTLDKQINDSIEYVKGYLTDKYTKKTAPDYFAAFGIVRNGPKFIIPKDRNKRSEALALMLAGLEKEGFTKNTYGTGYWQDIKSRFDEYLALATTTDSGVSEKTGNKNTVKKGLKKGLNSIILAIKANYPDTWKSELRNWGFQKEKY